MSFHFFTYSSIQEIIIFHQAINSDIESLPNNLVAKLHSKLFCIDLGEFCLIFFFQAFQSGYNFKSLIYLLSSFNEISTSSHISKFSTSSFSDKKTYFMI
jgi:hypothetical protein